MAGDLVLITGASGHLGFRVLVLALEAGYNARVAVRSQAKANDIIAAPSIKARNSGSNVTFTIVPDILADGAYDAAVKGVEYIIHCASPLTSGITDDFENQIIRPALRGTIGILESAQRTPGIKRVVITSSVVATIPFMEMFAESGKVFDGQLKVPFNPGPYKLEFEAYADSKVRALAATHDFVARMKPGFDVINLLPSFIIGKNELVTTVEDFAKGTNHLVFGQVLGFKNPAPLPGSTVYLNDVASLHVRALDPKIPGNQDYPANSGGIDGTTFSDAIDIISKNFPDAVNKGILPNDGTQPTKKLKMDVTKTEKVFGLTFAGLDKQVTEVAQNYLDLVAQS
ncbi:hypothetical protein V1505DRAFT_370126 [Lipomyces doorenjongii]